MKRVCELSLPLMFDGIIAWHSFFHLNPSDQRITLQNFAKHLKSGGVLMLTVGLEEGEVLGTVGNEDVYHASLSYEEYDSLLSELNIDILKFSIDDAECHGATILLAQKKE